MLKPVIALTAGVALAAAVGFATRPGQDNNGGTPAADIKRADGELLPVSDVRPGMKGYGLSVFSGTKIEKFDVEVVSVLKKFMGDRDIILVRVGHPVTDHANIIAGMSGSPVYFDGRLAGALSMYFTSFQKDPLAGVTPIEYMIADRDHPWENEDAILPPRLKDGPYQVCRTPLFFSGLPPAAFGDVKQVLEARGFQVLAGSAGQVDLAQDIALEPGAAVGVALLRGDIDATGIGTVTHVSGNDVLIFGHSMDMGGQVELPMTTAYVHTVIASDAGSFKMGAAVKPVGALLRDRITSVSGVLGKEAPMTPMTVEVENAQTHFKKTFRFEVARHPFYMPYLVAQLPNWCLLLSEAGEGKDQTIRYELRLKFEGMEPVELKDAQVSGQTQFGRGGMMETIFQLLGNPFRKVRLERADIKLSVVHRRASATVDAVWVQARQVKPGDTLRLTVRLRPYNKDPFQESLEIPLPRTLPEGEYDLAVMGGQETAGMFDMRNIMQALLSGGRVDMQGDQSFEELVQRIKRRHPAGRIVVRLELPALGVRYKGQKLENLPGSVFVNLVTTPSAGMKLERDQLEVTRDTAWIIEGQKSVKFEVRTPGRVEPEQQTQK
ncbi:MAG: hypothetical protein HYY16_00545 [Planctomycetes bacterium]|nr:hypothetical protein [Planctomycetota bacterium]